MKVFAKIIFLFFIFASANTASIFAQDDYLLLEQELLDNRKMTIHTDSSEIQFRIAALEKNKLLFHDTTRYYHWYRSRQIFATQGSFSGRLLEGEYVESYSNHALKEKGCFKKGLKIGQWKSWFSNGDLRQVVNFKRGRKHGKSIVYSENGNVLEKGKYKKGRRHGRWIFREGDKYVEKKYKKGRLIDVTFEKPETPEDASETESKR